MRMPRRRAVLLLGLAYVGFVSLGLPDGLLGVAWPSMRAQFGLALDALGPLLVATTAGYVLASFASGRLLARMRVGALLALSCLATAAALAGYATAPAWAVVVAFGALAGLGAGAIDAGLNTYVATQHSARTLNWLHACYGVGAATGPVLMTGVLMAGQPWQRGYAVVAGFQVALSLGFAAMRAWWPPPTPAGDAPAAAHAPARATLRIPAAWLGMAAFVVYVGLEQSAGAWAYSFLTEARGVPLARAGIFVSVFWGGLMAGRLVFGFVANRVAPSALVRGALVAIAASAALVAIDPLPFAGEIGLAALGFACGPVFPSLIAATPQRLGAAHAANGVGFQVAAAGLGQALVPWGVGVLARAHGLGMLAMALLALSVALLAIHALLVRAEPVALGATRIAEPT
jgi:fucose permease